MFVFLPMFGFVFVVFVFGWQEKFVAGFVFVFLLMFGFVLFLCLVDKEDLLLGLCLCLVDKEGQENARKSRHVFLCLNLDLCSLEFLLKMNWILILFFLFYFVKIDKLIFFFKMGGWRGIFIIILLATSVFTVQTVHSVCHGGYFR